jgi:hypothetical protein
MALMDDIIGIHRLNSYIIHYAGILQNLTQIITNDLERWAKGQRKFQTHVVLAVGARLGDMVSAEPVFRYMLEHQYKGMATTIISVAPRIFAHLGDKANIIHFDGHQRNQDEPAIVHNAMLPQEHEIWKFIQANTMHTVDFMSIVCLRHTLPDIDKQIKIGVSLSGITEILDVLGSRAADWQELILVHPGRGWPSKTFPIDYWQKIINELQKSGLKVGIIGKDIDEQIGVLQFETSEEIIDLREILTLDGLIALISRAPLLITNDSSPLHIAGAFDNHIILIPTCKHPDYILPWRNGTKHYKATALFEKLMCEDPSMDPTSLYEYGIKDIPTGHDIIEYLPPVSTVIDKAMQIMAERAKNADPKA